MSMKQRLVTCAAFACLAGARFSAYAEDHDYSEGPVINVASIRTVDGKFEEYMKWLDTTWKQRNEAAKKAGYILSYSVLQVQPRGPDDPDLYLVITYKNFAALDGSLAKEDALAKQTEGSVTAAEQSEFDRAKIRRVLGETTMRQLDLK